MPITVVIYCVQRVWLTRWHHIQTDKQHLIQTSRQKSPPPDWETDRQTKRDEEYWRKMECCHFAIHQSPNYAHLTNRATVRSRLISRQNPITARAFITRSCSSGSARAPDWRYSATWLRSVTSNLNSPSPDASQENAIIALKINLRPARPVWMKYPNEKQIGKTFERENMGYK